MYRPTDALWPQTKNYMYRSLIISIYRPSINVCDLWHGSSVCESCSWLFYPNRLLSILAYTLCMMGKAYIKPVFWPRSMYCTQFGLATRKLTVRPSVKRVICDKTKETCAHILIPMQDRSGYIQFCDKKNGWWWVTPSTSWNFRSNWPRWSENAVLQPIFARSA